MWPVFEVWAIREHYFGALCFDSASIPRSCGPLEPVSVFFSQESSSKPYFFSVSSEVPLRISSLVNGWSSRALSNMGLILCVANAVFTQVM